VENILFKDGEGVRIITINRPNQLNALNKSTINELSDLLDKSEVDTQIKAIILTGSGEKAFVAGADIKEFSDFNIDQGAALSKEGHEKLFDKLENLSTPVIAAVNGFALGGGLELAMSAHIRVASDNAKMGLPEVSLGVIPGYGGTQRLAQLVGKGRANELILTAGMISAEDAYRIGLVNHVVPQSELLATCQKMASRISRNSPRAISHAIKSVNAGFKDGVNGFDTEVSEFGKCFGTEDFKEGTSAFIEKRKPVFTGK
jgi:enoyl-CoA hydratase|tara:strand:+ start:3017 stop:3793 length:777 start_codon:yes stop_codon:yes gene_type:complete